MTDAPFVLAAYGIVVGGLAGYAVALARRTAAARRVAESLRREREAALTPPDVRAPLVAREPTGARR